jgi:putative addiction module killer protein
MVAMELRSTAVFDQWFDGLKDIQAKARITARLRRVELGNLGDCEPVGEGVAELRIHYGPGYRIYFCRKGVKIIVLLAGGDKSSQHRDIKKALDLSRQLAEDL